MSDPTAQDVPLLPDPAPRIVGAAQRGLRLNAVIVPVPPRSPAAEQSRLAWLWQQARYHAERAVQGAEALGALESGEARKAYAVLVLRRELPALRARAAAWLPGPVLALAFGALDRAAPWLVEQAFRRLSRWAEGAA